MFGRLPAETEVGGKKIEQNVCSRPGSPPNRVGIHERKMKRKREKEAGEEEFKLYSSLTYMNKIQVRDFKVRLGLIYIDK
jgi:hypothetical protein